MTRVRISGPANADLKVILAVSLDRWGEDGHARYVALLAVAFRAIAGKPDGPTTRDRKELAPGVRSFHLRHARSRGVAVKDPVHIVYYRVTKAVSIDIVRVLHERMDPTLHIRMPTLRARKSRR